jgi:hypothetical protein
MTRPANATRPVLPGLHRQADPGAAAARRLTYRLTYARTATPRRVGPGILDGPLIPDAHTDGRTSPGSWYDPRQPADTTQGAHLAAWLRMAVQEAVHEVLEHFQVDGRPYLDPHGPAEQTIMGCVDALADQLAVIVATPHLTGKDPIT